MRDDSNKTVHIGNLIENEVRRQQMPVIDFARKINTDRRNVYDIFSRTSIDTNLLLKICTVLNRDFFREFSKYLHIVHEEDDNN
ncbi:MAG: XRE family transcriptional regulator [Prevotella sp.]|nr:XRE family transcriptional regulator [Prevotella sp.]MCM1074841.1 hypothetical protein [Ruminococcus sp.]